MCKLVGEKLEYEVIASGSSGNAVKIGNILVDCGVSFKLLKDYLYDIDYLYLTHFHSDHIKESTLNKIKQLFPNIKIIGNESIAIKYGLDIVAQELQPLTINNGDKLTPFKCPHNVENLGFIIEYQNGKNLIYATDTYTLDFVPCFIKFDYVFLEANYDEEIIEAMRFAGMNNPKNRISVENAYRHLSKQKSKEFYYWRRKDKESLYVQLHKSSRFYQ